MGERIVGFFNEADKIGGILAKMRLAAATGVTSAEAGTIADTPEMKDRFEHALERLRGDMGAGQTRPPGVGRPAMSGSTATDVQALRRHVQVYLDLMSQRGLVLSRVDEAIRRVDEAAAEALACARVSVWLLDPARTKIVCADLFERGESKHSAGTELFAKDFAPYFAALERERTIAANDAHNDPRTSCFSEVYLAPLGIGAMLDVPIWVKERMIGVICHEHIGPSRVWTTDEEKFGYLMSCFLAMAYEREGR
jgi:hypothetical protein